MYIKGKNVKCCLNKKNLCLVFRTRMAGSRRTQETLIEKIKKSTRNIQQRWASKMLQNPLDIFPIWAYKVSKSAEHIEQRRALKILQNSTAGYAVKLLLPFLLKIVTAFNLKNYKQ